MTLHKLGEPEPDPPDTKATPITISVAMSDEEWNERFGHWRYQCDWCQQSYTLKEWSGFGLGVDDFTSLTSWDIDVWKKLLEGDAHFCDARCAGQYFLRTIGGYAVHVDFEPSP